jgi:hypothetical protein
MRLAEKEWDVSLIGKNQQGTIAVAFPMVVSRALTSAGYNRAVVTVTDDGILVRPYVSSRKSSRRGEEVQLPDWNGQ